MSFSRTFNMSSIEALASGPNKDELARAETMVASLVDIANEYRSLPEATSESLARGAQIVEPEMISTRLGEVVSAAKESFSNRIDEKRDLFSNDEINFMRRLELADINLRTDPGGSKRANWLRSYEKKGKSPTGNEYMSAKMERYNKQGSGRSQYDRVRVGVDHNRH